MRIFVVDDYPGNLQLLEGILSSGPYTVSSFINGKGALAAARKKAPDMFLLDVMMPEMDGFELCQQIQADPALRDRPVLFISALHDTETKIRALNLGGVDYITKPFLEEEVHARISSHLRLSAQKRELKVANTRLHELEEARETFIHMLVHDFRSPMTGISMALESIRMDLDPASLHDLADQGIATLHHLKLMVNTLLDFSRLEAASMPIQPVSTCLQTLLEDLSASMPVQRCRWELSQDLTAFCDPSLTQRILQNLISNALKYSPPDETVIRAFPDKGQVKVEISDKGPGIPREHQKVIFRKFYQLSDSKGIARKGHGIGLAFCKLAVESQGGEMGVVSPHGGGTCFWFTLPLQNNAV